MTPSPDVEVITCEHTIIPAATADAENGVSACTHRGMTCRCGYGVQVGLPVTRSLECGSHAAASTAHRQVQIAAHTGAGT